LRTRTIYLLILILALFGVALWSILPVSTNLLGPSGLRLGLDLKGGSYLIYQADLRDVAAAERAETMRGVKEIIENRVDALGIAESIVQVKSYEGEYSIAIQLPGIADIEEAKTMVGLVTVLEFREWSDAEEEWIPAAGTVTVDGEQKDLVLSSRYFKERTFVTLDDLTREPLLIFEWDETGQQLSEQITGRLVGKQLAIYLGEEPLLDEEGQPIAPVVREVIRESGQISGLDLATAQMLSRFLNAGRIPVPLGRWVEEESREFEPGVPLYERTVDATLGRDSIDKSLIAAAIGIVLLVILMIVYYRFLGLMACLSLGVYGVLAFAIFDLFSTWVTLTLPGIAGFILSLGMAVDANVLIFERIKEELRGGRSLGAAVEAGFTRAWSAIRDSNITTFIACFVLIWLGGELGALMVRGFALTLLIGVALSMFTAIVVTRTFLRLIVGGHVVSNLAAYGVRPAGMK
jgi:preprotein translocase subunit SecD